MSDQPITPEALPPVARHRISRRRLLQAGAATAVVLAEAQASPLRTAAAPAAQEPLVSEKPGSTNIVHSRTPPLEETRVEELEGLLTPTRNFFIRNHFATPQLDPQTWRLRVEGHVEAPFELTYEELRNLPEQKSVIAFLECAGNGRRRFDPPAEGTPWLHGAAGTAEWTGVPVAVLLERARVRPGAVDLVAEGGDSGRVTRGLPLSVALRPDTLVVWAMNGEPLLPSHGAPVRLFVPGWVGVASIKWLVRLAVIDRPFDGVYNTTRYVYLDRPSGRPTEPATVQPVKSYINRPTPDAVLDRGSHLITGYAWSGYGPIARVEVSTDGGETWAEAQLLEPRLPLAWVRFAYRWEPPAPGTYVLASRATDEQGNVQPETVEWNRQGYHMNAIYRLTVVVT
ncbi:MAG TPA: sulfite oxidase [Chloroflexota bacterium]|nr:sulfite oxidase [Chloroflexota bacterium]